MKVDDAHDIDIVMSMHNLMEYSYNYSKASRILWQYFEDEPAINVANGDIADFNAANATANSFKVKVKMACKQATIDVGIMAPLRYLSILWRPLEILWINCEINLDINWSKECVIVATAVAGQDASFSVTDRKRYVPVVTLSTQDNTKLFEQSKCSFKRTIDLQ